MAGAVDCSRKVYELNSRCLAGKVYPHEIEIQETHPKHRKLDSQAALPHPTRSRAAMLARAVHQARGSSRAAIGMSPNSPSAFVSIRRYSAFVLGCNVLSNSSDKVNRRIKLLNVPASQSRISFSNRHAHARHKREAIQEFWRDAPSRLLVEENLASNSEDASVDSLCPRSDRERSHQLTEAQRIRER